MKESQQSYLRYPRYFRVLRTLLVNGVMKVSSGELALELDITPSTVRADLNRFEGAGQQGYGYHVKQLYREISSVLGAGDGRRAVLIGGSPAVFPFFAEKCEGRGVILTGQVTKAGELSAAAGSDIALVLSLPEGITPAMLPSIGFRGVWNMTQEEYKLPIPVINLPVGDILMQLCYQIREEEDRVSEDPI